MKRSYNWASAKSCRFFVLVETIRTSGIIWACVVLHSKAPSNARRRAEGRVSRWSRRVDVILLTASLTPLARLESSSNSSSLFSHFTPNTKLQHSLFFKFKSMKILMTLITVPYYFFGFVGSYLSTKWKKKWNLNILFPSYFYWIVFSSGWVCRVTSKAMVQTQ